MIGGISLLYVVLYEPPGERSENLLSLKWTYKHSWHVNDETILSLVQQESKQSNALVSWKIRWLCIQGIRTGKKSRTVAEKRPGEASATYRLLKKPDPLAWRWRVMQGLRRVESRHMRRAGTIYMCMTVHIGVRSHPTTHTVPYAPLGTRTSDRRRSIVRCTIITNSGNIC